MQQDVSEMLKERSLIPPCHRMPQDYWLALKNHTAMRVAFSTN